MTDNPVDLEKHRIIAAQRVEVLRRKQLEELRANVREMKIQQDALEKRLLAAIVESERNIADAEDYRRNGVPASATTGMTRLSDNGAANANGLLGGQAFKIDRLGSIPSSSNNGEGIQSAPKQVSLRQRQKRKPRGSATAIVYCEANFGEPDGKTANGLVRHSEKYQIIAIIDSGHTGQDAGVVLDGEPNGIPICRDLAEAIAQAAEMPSCFIYGMAPSSGMLSMQERGIALDAMGLGMDIVSGLHEFLSEDDEFTRASAANNVNIFDVRLPQSKTKLKLFTGHISKVTCPRIAVLGTDCAIGKRTTASILTKELNERGITTVMVSTGQTGIIQGARYGVALDAIPSQFCAGELEAAVITAFESERPDLIVIEGQGALSHPAFSTSAFILRGSQPTSVILQHAPRRVHRCDFEDMAMPNAAEEIKLIECFADTHVIGLAINHENMSDEEVKRASVQYRRELGIPATAPLRDPPDRLIEMVVKAYPQLRENLNKSVQ
ncbi:MAG: DUF1611 domain-containing protein [Hyphomicrobiaceae bacterium]